MSVNNKQQSIKVVLAVLVAVTLAILIYHLTKEDETLIEPVTSVESSDTFKLGEATVEQETEVGGVLQNVSPTYLEDESDPQNEVKEEQEPDHILAPNSDEAVPVDQEEGTEVSGEAA